MDNVIITAKGKQRGLDILESVIGSKNIWRNGILSDNLGDEVVTIATPLK